jgi:hypothetical protein
MQQKECEDARIGWNVDEINGPQLQRVITETLAEAAALPDSDDEDWDQGSSGGENNIGDPDRTSFFCPGAPRRTAFGSPGPPRPLHFFLGGSKSFFPATDRSLR